MKVTWTAATIGSALARNTFKNGLCVVPNCTWTGYECDLLVVTEKLLIVDVEIKISRADLKADAKKDKWWSRKFVGVGPEERVERDGRLVAIRRPPIYEEQHREWPPKVWKHYYAFPRALWKPELMNTLGSSSSGVILLGAENAHDRMDVTVERRAKPNTNAQPIGAMSMKAIARLASLRMWDAFKNVELIQDDLRRTRALLSAVDDASITKPESEILP